MRSFKKIRRLPVLLLIFFLPLHQKAQKPAVPDLIFPWTGGLNSAQFCSIDLNLDGISDLVIFDRHGNRIIPFINENPVPGEMNYAYAPQYISAFPDLHDWVQMIDYDQDGRMDLFTCGEGGARVFRNSPDSVLKFQLVTDLLSSFYYTGKVGILITTADYPAFTDVDHDGDLDLLTFFGLGAFVEYHRNLSMEKYGIPDSLDLRLEDKCWGDFREGLESNILDLNVVCPYKKSFNMTCTGERHTGSTLLATDLNHDGLTDLILGDIDYPQLITLINGGTIDSAHMISQDTIFPFASHPVRLFSFPACSFLDMDNDGLRDIIVSPFDPSMKAENFRSCWFYRNEGSNENPVFTFKKDRFFQDGMIDLGSAAHPLFADVDGDGLTDLLAGNYGYYDSSWYENGILHSSFISKIAWFRNTGDSAHPEFSLITDDFASLSQLKATGLFPAFGDLDGDARPDLIAGREDGTVIFLKNNSLPEGPPSFERPVLNFKNIDVGEYSAPQPFDLDKDGLQDLIIGEKAGNLNYYRNTGSSGNPAFTLVTDSLGKINVTNYALSYDGYSTPCFFRFPDGTTGLLAGAEEGKIHFYSGIDGHLGDPFGESDTLGRIINGESIELTRGMQFSPAIANLSGGNYFDLVYGNFGGGMNYCSYGAAPKVITGVAGHSSSSSAFYTISPNPADQFVNIRATTAGRYTVSFIDLQGRQVQFCQLTGNQSISVSGLSAGLYVLILSPLSSQTDIKPLIYKVLIQH